MTEAQIKVKRTESILQEIIPEGLGQLNDNRLHEIDIVEVKCSKGRSDAKVYIDPSYFSDEEKRTIKRQLRKARPIVENYCMKDQGWFKCPTLKFEFDEQLKITQNLEDLFKKIAKPQSKDET